MASLLTNGVFSPQPISETPKISSSKLEISYITPTPNSNPHSARFLKLRADAKTTLSADVGPLQKYLKRDYNSTKGFNQKIDSFTIPKGLSEETIRLISSMKEEPDWMLEFRLNSYHKFCQMTEPNWSDNHYPKIDLQNISYYSEPKNEADPKLLDYFHKLGVPLNEQKCSNVARDVVYDSVSIAVTNTEPLEELGVIFCSISDAIKNHPDKIKKYLGKVVSPDDNFYAALNSAVFSDGSFLYIPKNTKCPMQIATDFRINAIETGQFERTLIIADEGSFVEYHEGCSAPSYSTNQLHAAVVELHCNKEAEIKYSTLQNWYPGDENGRGGVFNFVTKRGLCAGRKSKISWTQVETGAAVTWKYPSVVLEGDESVGEFYSVALTKNRQQADTGTKMIHKGKNTKSRIVSKGICAGNSRNCYRGLVQVQSRADNARNSSQCDSMLIGDMASANTYPYIQAKNPSARIEHEASTSKIGEEQIFYFQQRGIDCERAMAAMISGFCSDVFNKLNDEYSAEMKEAMSLKLEKSVD